MIKTRSKKDTAKILILIAILDIFSLELCRTILEIQFSLFYLLSIITIFALQISFLKFIEYMLKKMGRPKKEFRINEFLTLKLEKKTTNIYVNGKVFTHCKFLLINIPLEKVKEFDKIESIDEAAEKLDHELEYQPKTKVNISPETEFWGHCSNLQAWVEYHYNPRLLHSNLAFPLLKKLTDAGDLIARKVFKQEVQSRFESFNPSTQQSLIKKGYLKYFNKEEKEEIFKLILDEKTWLNLGYNYLNANKIEKALHSFLRARNINPINLKTLFIILQIYARNNDHDKASNIVNDILGYYPENLKTIIGKDYTLQARKKSENFYYI
ncbi:MAG: tetratricopeptide repeat protein [Promethearchaeota archaeon]